MTKYNILSKYINKWNYDIRHNAISHNIITENNKQMATVIEAKKNDSKADN